MKEVFAIILRKEKQGKRRQYTDKDHTDYEKYGHLPDHADAFLFSLH
jgi:hypothetical protein